MQNIFADAIHNNHKDKVIEKQDTNVSDRNNTGDIIDTEQELKEI